MANVKSVTIYGIKNCDTMKKARSWLDKGDVAYAFHDYKTAGIERDMLEGWARGMFCRRRIGRGSPKRRRSR